MTSTGTDHALPADATGGDDLRSPKSARAALDALDTLARSGGLPGFERTSPTSGVSRLFGQPFDRELLVDASDAAHGSVVRLRTRLKRKTPIIFAVIAVLTVWPGVWLTDSLIQTYFPGAANWVVQTWMWYLPLAILPLPFAARSMWRKSQAAAAEHYAEIRERVAKAVGASMDASAAGGRTVEGASAESRDRQTLSASA